MRALLACLALLTLPACTSLQQVQEDLGGARGLVRESIGRQAESVGWRDGEILRVHMERSEALRRAADDAVREGDLEKAQEIWMFLLATLESYRPVEAKVKNIGRVIDTIRDEPGLEEVVPVPDK